MGTAIYAPDGTVRDIPDDQLQAAIGAGGVRAVKMRDPKGDQRYVPLTSVPDAVKAGGRVDESTETPKEGFWKSLGQDLGAMAKGAAPMLLGAPGIAYQGIKHGLENAESVASTGKTTEEKAYDERIAAGRDPKYAAAATLNEAIGVNAKGMEQAADKGDSAGVLGHAAAVPVATAITAGVTKGVAKVAPEVAKFASAESNPNKLYNSYLGPVADTPHPVPNAPTPVMKAVLRDMEAAGDGEIAARIKDGTATIGDLDQARMRANRLARSIYRSPGNYSPGLAEGADKFASAIRDQIYPEIEKAHGMEPGALRDVKNLQGKLMEAERSRGLINKVVTQGLGAGAGAYLGNETGIPGGAYVGGAIGAKLAEPIATGINRGVIGLQTKATAMNLPQPVAPAAAAVAPQPPIAGLLPKPAVITPPPAPFNGVPVEGEYMPPPVAATTRAERLGLLLPERTGPTPLGAIKGEEAMQVLRAKSVVVRDPNTGQMRRMYVTGDPNASAPAAKMSGMVTDESGKPATLYHGTSADFQEFSNQFDGKNSRAFPQGKGIGYFFSTDPEFVKPYGKFTKEVNLDLSKPFQMTKDQFESQLNSVGGEALKSKLQAQGYDGIELLPKTEKLGRFDVSSPRNYIAFDKSKIKILRTSEN